MVIIKNYTEKKIFNKLPEISGKIGIISRNFRTYNPTSHHTINVMEVKS